MKERQYKCMIVDDEPLAIKLIESHINQTPEFLVVQTASNPLDAIRILKDVSVDLLFLDIQMPVLTGIEMVKTLANPPRIIFTTAYRDYAAESYELDVVDYLLKPVTYMRFLKAINKFLALIESNADSADGVNTTPSPVRSMYVNVNKKYVKIIFDKVDYIESVKDYIHIHLGDHSIVTKSTISDFQSNLPANFLRVHRSFIVNLQKLTAFTSQDVEIGQREIPIGASYKDQILLTLKNQ